MQHQSCGSMAPSGGFSCENGHMRRGNTRQRHALSGANRVGLAPNVSFHMASRLIAEQGCDVLKAVLSAINEIDDWIKNNRKLFTAELALKTGFPSR